MFRKILSRLAKINRLWLLFFLAIVLGVVSTVLSSSYLKSREKNITAELKSQMSGGPTVEVLVSSQNLPQGSVLGNTLVKRDVPRDLVEDDTLTPKDFDRVAGVKLMRPLRAGYPINTSYFVEKNRTFSDAVEEGKRAITIEVDEINSMAQMVKPGNRVDLMLIVPDKSDPDGGVEVMMVLQNVKVLATGQSVAPKEDPARSKNSQAASGKEQSYSNFTFEVTPQEAATIALAQNSGKIRAVLRTLGDEKAVALKDVNTRTLLRVEQKMAEKRKIAAQTRLQDMAAEQDMADNVKTKSASRPGGAQTIEYVIGGMGAGAAGMGRPEGNGIQDVEGAKTKEAPAAPAVSRANAAQMDAVQSAVADALKRSGIPTDAMPPAAPRGDR